MGLEFWPHAWAFAELARKSGRFEVAAFSSSRDDLAQEFQKQFGGIERSGDYREMVKRADVDFALVATTVGRHAEAAQAALKAGKPVLAGKPLAMTAREGRSLALTAQITRQPLSVQYYLRHCLALKKMKELLASGALGRPLDFSARLATPPPLDAPASLPNRNRGWWADPGENVGGALATHGIYLINLSRWFLGEATLVSALTQSLPLKDIVFEDWATATLAFKNGANAVLTAGQMLPAGSRGEFGPFILTGSEASVMADFSRTPNLWLRKKDAAAWSPLGTPTLIGGDPRLQGSQGMVENFLDCLEKKTEPEIGADEAVEDLRILLAAYESAKKGRTVSLARGGAR